MSTPGGLVDKQELIDAQLDTAHLGRVVNSKDASGAPISESTNRTGGVNKTLDALEAEYQGEIDSLEARSDQAILDAEAEFDTQRDQFDTTFQAQFAYKRIGNISLYAGDSLPEVDKLNSYQYPDDSGEWFGPVQSQSFPTTIPADPSSSDEWALVNALTPSSLRLYADISYGNLGGKTAFENMVLGESKVGDRLGTPGMQWERIAESIPSSEQDFRPLMPVTPSTWGLNTPGFNNADAIQSALEYCQDNNTSFIAPTVDVETDKTIFLPNFPSFDTYQVIDFAGMRIRPDDTVFKPMQSGKRVGGVWESAMSDPLQTNMTFNTKLTGLVFVRDDPETKDGRVALELKDWHQSCELETLIARNFQSALDSYNNFYLNYGNLKLQNAALASGERTGIGFIFRTANNLNNIKQLVSQNVDTGYIFEGLVTALHIESISQEGQNHGLITTGEVRGMTVSGTYGEYNNIDSEDFFDFQGPVYNVAIDGGYYTSSNPNTWVIKSNSNPRSAIMFGKNNNLSGTLNETRVFENKGYGYRTIGYTTQSQGSNLENIEISESDVGIGTVVEGYSPNIGSGAKTYNIALLNGGIIPSSQSGRMTCGFDSTVMHGLYDPVNGTGQVAFKSRIIYSDTQEVMLAFRISDVNGIKTIKGRMVGNQFYEYTASGLVQSSSVTMSAATGFIIFTVSGSLSGTSFNVLGAEARVV